MIDLFTYDLFSFLLQVSDLPDKFKNKMTLQVVSL